MEKKFTLMKTLTAILHLLFPRSNKNCRAVTNDQTSTGGCGTTTVNNHLIYTNDARQTDASFLFFEAPTISDEASTIDVPGAASDGQQSKNKEELKKLNDELALGSAPKPVYNNWKQRVDDDLAACSAVVSLESVIVSRESITITDELFKTTPPTSTTLTKETRTNKNDAFLPFASFYSFIRRLVRRNFNEGESFSEGGFFVRRGLGVGGSFVPMIIAAVFKSLKQDDCSKNPQPVFIPIKIYDKSKMRFPQNRFNKKN